jgi:hypothetical protein
LDLPTISQYGLPWQTIRWLRELQKSKEEMHTRAASLYSLRETQQAMFWLP